MNDVLVIRVSRCGVTRGTLYGKHVLTLIWVIMTGGSFKIVSNWAVLTPIVAIDKFGDGLGLESHARVIVASPCLPNFCLYIYRRGEVGKTVSWDQWRSSRYG